jgi:DNA polymerase-3 subunit chi
VTTVDFHVWPEEARRQHDVRVCELVERAWQAGREVYIHCLDDDMAQSLDDLLWTFHDTSFVPHALAGTPESAHVKVVLGTSAAAPAGMDTLINLHVEVPGFFSQFEQVLETTGHDPHTRQLARERYRFYKDRGYPLNTRQG